MRMMKIERKRFGPSDARESLVQRDLATRSAAILTASMAS